MQSSYRVRYLINNNVYFSIPEKKEYTNIKQMGYSQLNLYFNFDKDTEESIILNNKIINEMEQNIDKVTHNKNSQNLLQELRCYRSLTNEVI